MGSFPINPPPPHSNLCFTFFTFCIVNKPIIANTFVLHTLHRKVTHSAILIRKTTSKIENLKCGGEVGCFSPPKPPPPPYTSHKHQLFGVTGGFTWLKFELYAMGITHRVISDRVHRLLVTLSYFRPDRFVQLLSLIPILILLLYYLVSGCLTSLF